MAGDLGDGLYVTVANEPSHTCRLSITLAAGATQWYSLTSFHYSPRAVRANVAHGLGFNQCY